MRGVKPNCVPWKWPIRLADRILSFSERSLHVIPYHRILIVLCAVGLPHLAWAASARTRKVPLFSKGVETFKLETTQGKPATFVVLNDSATERALAVTIATALNAQPETQPKIPINGQLQLNLERMTIAPQKDKPQDLAITVRVSGHDLTLPRTVDRSTFLSGKVIEMNFPKEERSLTGFTIEGGGKLKFRFDPKRNEVAILNAEGKMKYDTILGDYGKEQIRFQGRGVRQIL